MFEWSETDLMIRDAVRGFIAKEIRPNLDALESGEITPYPIIRKLFAEFGIDAMSRDSVEKMLAKERARASGDAPRGDGGKDDDDEEGGSGDALSGRDSMMAVVISELAGACMGLVSALGVSLGLGATTIASRGTLAQKERWLPGIMTCLLYTSDAADE